MDHAPKMPHKIKDVVNDIRRHPNFGQLDQGTRMEFEGCDTIFGRTREDNKWLRELWTKLYL